MPKLPLEVPKTLGLRKITADEINALTTSPAARQARRRAWLEERLQAIVTAHRDLETPSAIDLLREACEAWGNVE